MKKLVTTATALMFALGLTAAAQAQTAVEKSKTAPVQKVTTQETGKEAAKAEAPKVAPAEVKKVEATATTAKQTAEKGKETAVVTDKQTGKEIKATANPEKKPGQEIPKTDKK